MRILQVIDGLKQRAGVANVVMNYYRFVDKTRMQFDFLVVDYEENLKEEVESLGGRVYTMEMLGITNAKRFCSQLEDFFSQHAGEYKIVHSHFYQIDFLLFPIAKKYGARHCMMHSHSTKYADYTLRKMRNWALSKLSCAEATDFAACSRAAGEFLFGKRAAKQKLFILNNAIDTERFAFDPNCRRNMREQLGITDKYVIGHVGSFYDVKNHKFLVSVFAEYAKQDPQALLLLVGEGPLLDNIKEQVRCLGIADRVLFLGRRTDVPALLHAMDGFVLPSKYEGLPVSLMEAQAAGLPAAVSDAVPREAAATDLVQFLSIKDSSQWTAWFSDAKKVKRIDARVILRRNGYDMKTQAVCLEDYYIGMANQ